MAINDEENAEADIRHRKAYVSNLTESAIKEYGPELGRAFADFVLTGHDSKDEKSLQAKNTFYTRIITFLDNGSAEQRILALRAMIEASELRTDMAILNALSNINGRY